MSGCKFMFRAWRPKNCLEALVPLRFLTWIFSIGIIFYPLDRPRIRLSIFYGISTTFAYLTLWSYTLLFAWNSSWFGDTEAILFGIGCVNVFMYLSNIMLMWIWGKTTENIFERMTKADELLEKLDVPLDYQKIYVLSLRILSLWIFITLTLNIVNIMWFIDIVDLYTNYIMMYVVAHPIHANSIITLMASVTIRIMELRFKKINELLLEIVDRKRKRLTDDIDRQWISISCNVGAGNSCMRADSQNTTTDIVRIAKRLHLELSILCSESSRVFGIQLAMDLASSFVIVTGATFVLYLIMVSPKIDRLERIHRIIVIVIWLVAMIAKIFTLNKISDKALTEWRRTGRIIRELGIISKDDGYRDEIRQFSLQILQNPVSFTAYGLVTLGDSFTRAFIGSVTTYVIILVQMYDTPT